MKRLNYFLVLMVPLLSSCTTSPTTGGKRLLGLVPIPFTGGPRIEPDPYHMWQEWAIYIIIGGIVIGAIDFSMDRKLSWLGPAIAGCGLAISIWGVALGIINTILPWILGGAVVAWLYLRWYKAQEKKNDFSASNKGADGSGVDTDR